MAEELDISKSLEQSIRDSRRIQEDTNSELNKSINLLSQINDLREQSIAKVKALNKESINTKDIQKELKKAKEKEELSSIKISKLEDSLSQKQKTNAKAYLASIKGREILEEKIQRAKLKGDLALVASLGNQLNIVDRKIDSSEKDLNLDERKYAAALESKKVALETKSLLEDELASEKEINKSIGITGRVMGIIGKKLGANNDIYGDMVQKARDLNSEGEKLTFGDKLLFLFKSIGAGLKEALSDPLVLVSAAATKAYSLIKTGLGMVQSGFDSLTGTGGPISKFVSPFSNLIKQIPLIGGLLGGVVDILANVADYATEAGSQVQLFARNLGLSFTEAQKLNAQYSDLTLKSGNLLYNSRKFRETQLEIAEATGLNNLLSEKALQTQIDLKELFGIDLETRKELVNVERVSGVEQDKIVKAAMGTSNFISKTLGVSIKWQSILKEASSLSGFLGLSFAKYPEKLTRSLATVKAMGLELKQLDSLADSFLDFESSITKEFEAQLLTGKDINLAKAREAFLNNDLVTAGKELVDQLGTSAEFYNYNRIQQDAIAAAAGMTRDQVSDMLKQQELFSKLQVNDIKAYQQKVALMTKTVEGQQELVSLLGEEEYSKVMSQTATEKIANFIEKIKQSFADLLSSSSFKGFLDKVIAFISDPKNIEALLSKITGFISAMISAVAYVLKGLDQLPFVEIDKGLIKSIQGYADELSNAKLGSLINSEGGVSVGDKVANEQINSAKQPVPVDDMSMKSSPKQPMVLKADVTTYVVDTKKEAEVRWGYSPDFDMQT